MPPKPTRTRSSQTLFKATEAPAGRFAFGPRWLGIAALCASVACVPSPPEGTSNRLAVPGSADSGASAPDSGGSQGDSGGSGSADSGVAPDSGTSDSGAAPDSGPSDSGTAPDSGASDSGVAPDAGSPDSGVAQADAGGGPSGGDYEDPGELVAQGSYGTCGNGVLERGEVCDDGNLTLLDGCSNTCLKDGARVQPAFLGAEGFGAKTRGGRGGKVYTVTTLNWSGPGSYSEAMGKTEPRIIVFAVSGVIVVPETANDDLNLGPEHSYVTVAGQTSPGGITFQGNYRYGTPLWSYPEERLDTVWRRNDTQFHDAIFQHLRFRGLDNEDNVSLYGVHNLLFDHCDFSGAYDESFDISHGHDITVQWSTIANSGTSWSEQRYGALIAYYPTTNISMHHNLHVNHDRRCGAHLHWEIEGRTPPGGAYLDFVENVLHNCGHESFYYGNTINENRVVYANAIGNTLGIGSNTETGTMGILGFAAYSYDYCADNATIDNLNTGIRSYPCYVEESSPTVLSSATPMAPVTRLGRAAAYERVLAEAGAWPRDAMNRRSVQQVRDGSGSLGDNISELITSGPAAPPDGDGDGMPDDWERAQGMNPAVDDSAGDLDGDGWTNIEEYLYARAQAIIGQ